MTEYKLTRNVTRFECHWIDRDYEKGEIFYPSTEFHYGCISPYGIFCMESSEKPRHIEIPKDALNLSQVLLEKFKNERERPIKLTLISDLKVEEFPFILKDFKRGEVVYFYPDFDPSKIYIDCIPAVLNAGDDTYCELPNWSVRSFLG